MALKGRPKGAKNKYSKDLKLRIEQFCSGNFDEFEAGWKSLPPSSPVKYTVFCKLLQIVMPKEIDPQRTTSVCWRYVSQLKT